MLVSQDGKGGQNLLLLLLLGFSTLISVYCEPSDTTFQEGMDILYPYTFHHGPKNRNHRDTQTCQNVIYGNVTHSLHAAKKSPTIVLPLVETYYHLKKLGAYWETRYVNIHHFVVNNPLSSLSVLEPGHPGSCGNGSGLRFTVRESSKQKNCLASVNGGYFDTHTGQCHGNIISDGLLVQDSGGVQNAHFGLTEKGDIYIGYLSELDLITQGFTQLVGGVIWLVRDGKNYVTESKKLECSDTQETGSADRFINVISARTAIGHDKEGRVHIMQVNGKSDMYGINLFDLADVLIEHGIVNAINLDGGGSSSAVANGTVINFPSDSCPNKTSRCERAVSTIVCVHEPVCPDDCSGHGTCHIGLCHCIKPWTGQACGKLGPTRDCGEHGRLQQDMCTCDKGWLGENCTMPCPAGTFGFNCSSPCVCSQDGQCDKVTGVCHCGPGYIGKYCEKKCPYGSYGTNCAELCFCRDSCFCDPVTGGCNVTSENEDYIRAGKCIARKRIVDEHLVPDRQGQFSMCLTSLVCLTIVAAASLVLNAVFSIMMLRKKNTKPRTDQIRMRRIRRQRKRPKMQRLQSSSSDIESPLPNGRIERVSADELTLTGSGEDEEDVFLARKKTEIS